MKNKDKSVKEKIAVMKKKVKGKIAKLKGKGASVAVVALALLAVCGCLDTAPASRATTASVSKPSVDVTVGSGASNVVVTAYIHVQDIGQASADSEGSTETQTITPTMDIRPDIDVRYNDAIAGATAASKSVLGSIGDGLTAVLDLMQSKKSGTVAVTKTDGTAATVKCEDGQCSFCEDCQP